MTQDVAPCRAGVISEPEFCVVDLASEDETLILASDGVSEFMSDEEAVDIVCNGSAADAEEACSQVRRSELQRTAYHRCRCLYLCVSAAYACGYTLTPA